MTCFYYDFWRNRIGDKVATSACLKWFKQINQNVKLIAIDDNKSFGERLSSMPSSVIFSGLIDGVARKRPPDSFGINFGCIWIRLPWLAEKNIYPSIKVDTAIELELLNRFEWMSEPYVCIHILEDAPYNIKRNIDFDSMQELITRLSNYGYRVVRVGKWLGKIAKHCIDTTTEHFTVMQSAVIVKNSFCYIGGDTGVTHIAAAVGVPNIFAIYDNKKIDEEKWKRVAARMNCNCSFSTIPNVSEERLSIVKMHEHTFDVKNTLYGISEKMDKYNYSTNIRLLK